MIKPSGIYHIKEILNEFKPYQITKIIIIDARTYEEPLRFFYPGCPNKVFGIEWYNYLKTCPLILIRFLTNIPVNHLDPIKQKIRKNINIIWTRNSIHAPENNLEHNAFKHFFDNWWNNTPIDYKKHDLKFTNKFMELKKIKCLE